jgi:hypothetical protein
MPLLIVAVFVGVLVRVLVIVMVGVILRVLVRVLVVVMVGLCIRLRVLVRVIVAVVDVELANADSISVNNKNNLILLYIWNILLVIVLVATS